MGILLVDSIGVGLTSEQEAKLEYVPTEAEKEGAFIHGTI